MKNIIFLLDAQKKPSGGGKVIYQYSNYINTKSDFSSSIIHLEKKKIAKWINSIKKKIIKKKSKNSGWNFDELQVKQNYKFKWFSQDIVSKNNLKFDKENDFVVLPEIFAHFADDFLIRKKIPYAIFVQNGYAIFSTNNFSKLNLAYKKANFILSYSKDIDSCVQLAFPKVKNKIVQVRYSIDCKKFNIPKKKSNIITYMPRKLQKHSELVIFFLKKYLPKRWKIKKIDNCSERDVYKNLEKSKIFLAFSNLEGLPLPPVEAAIAGNKVIGYTGEGGKEYWKEPIFTEIKTSEIKNFCRSIVSNLENKNFYQKSQMQRKSLEKKFSVEIEKKYIDRFLNKVKKISIK